MLHIRIPLLQLLAGLSCPLLSAVVVVNRACGASMSDPFDLQQICGQSSTQGMRLTLAVIVDDHTVTGID